VSFVFGGRENCSIGNTFPITTAGFFSPRLQVFAAVWVVRGTLVVYKYTAGFVQAALYTTRRIHTLDLSLTRGWDLEDLCINASWGLEGVVKRKFFISYGAILSSSKHK